MLDTPEPLRNLADLIAAQLEYHKKAYEILSELAPVVDGLQVEQEVGAEAVGAIIIRLMCESRPAIGRAGNCLEVHASCFKRAFRVHVLPSLPNFSCGARWEIQNAGVTRTICFNGLCCSMRSVSDGHLTRDKTLTRPMHLSCGTGYAGPMIVQATTRLSAS